MEQTKQVVHFPMMYSAKKFFLENPAVDELPYIVFDNTKPVKNMREIGFECKTGKSDESLSI